MLTHFNVKAYRARKRLGELLIETGYVTEDQVNQALELQKERDEKLGEILVKEGFISEEQILKVLETQLGIQYMDIKKVYIDEEAVNMIPEKTCRKYCLLPIEVMNGELVVAMKDPLNYYAIDDIKICVPLPVKPVISTETSINGAIEKYFGKHNAEKAAQEFEKEYTGHSDHKDEAIDMEHNKEIEDSPIVKYVNSIIENSVRNGASDIHIEPEDGDVRIRVRVDGVLTELMSSSSNMLNAIVTRIKVMGDMDVAEKRIPQDGRVQFKIDDKSVDLRVSTIPTKYGEKIVMRVLDKTNFVLSKNNLGLSPSSMEMFDRLISKPYGILLVTGPTGSGKTSTLYTVLSEVNDIKKNIITLEDPIEYNLKGVNQTQLNTKAGLTFSAGLRAVLRQDPDIVMVGEIRDAETAEIAMRAALTGHLVLSTLHTNDAPGSISRLTDMNIQPFLVSSSLIGVIAQRLIRKICPSCKDVYEADERERKLLDIDDPNLKLSRGKGCKLCGNTGYKGRTAIFEMMEMTKDLRILIDSSATPDILRDQAIKEGMITLRESCKRLVLDSVTTIQEMIRITLT